MEHCNCLCRDNNLSFEWRRKDLFVELCFETQEESDSGAVFLRVSSPTIDKYELKYLESEKLGSLILKVMSDMGLRPQGQKDQSVTETKVISKSRKEPPFDFVHLTFGYELSPECNEYIVLLLNDDNLEIVLETHDASDIRPTTISDKIPLTDAAYSSVLNMINHIVHEV